MKLLLIIPLVLAKTQREICKENPNSAQCKVFNILSLTSSNYNGYMTSKFVEYLEKSAYFEAISK